MYSKIRIPAYGNHLKYAKHFDRRSHRWLKLWHYLVDEYGNIAWLALELIDLYECYYGNRFLFGVKL